MARGKRRDKILAQSGTDKNTVYVKYWRDTDLFDISVPDRSVAGFYLRHVKGIPKRDVISLLECLSELKRGGHLK